MKPTLETAFKYQDDHMNLPVRDVDAAGYWFGERQP